MKRFAFFCLIYLTVSALGINGQELLKHDSIGDFVEWKHKKRQSKALGDTLYYEDFGSGGPSSNQLPLGWTRQNWAGNSNDWIWTTSFLGGQYSQNVGSLNSTTGSNGFLSLPSDLYNTPAMMFVNMDAAVSSPPIPIPQKGAWLLQFQQANRFCCSGGDSALVAEVSTDGQQWTSFDATFNRGINFATPNAMLAEINVSSVLSFQDTAYIRFRQTGPSHYYWMVDDVALVEGPTNAFQLNDLTLQFSDTFSVNPIYTQVPLSMVDSFSVSAIFENVGSFSQSGFRVDYRIYQDSSLNGGVGNGLVFSDSILYAQAVSPFFIDTVIFDSPKFKPSQTGFYRCEVSLSSDSVNQYSQFSRKSQSFIVSDSIIARDWGIYNGGISAHLGFSSPVYDSNKIAVLFNAGPIFQQIKALRFFVHNSTVSVGARVRPMLWEFDFDVNNFNNSFRLKAQDTAAITITSAMLDSWIHLPFDADPNLSDLTLTPGKQYLMGWEQVSGAPKEFTVARDYGMEAISPPISNFVFVNDQNPSWGWITQVPAVRAVVETAIVNLAEGIGKTAWQVIPNPNQGVFTLKLGEVNAYQLLELRDLKGQLIRQAKLNGNQIHHLDFSDLESGIYLISLFGETNRETQKLIVY